MYPGEICTRGFGVFEELGCGERCDIVRGGRARFVDLVRQPHGSIEESSAYIIRLLEGLYS